MYRTFEAIFRRPIQILSLIILLPIISLAIAPAGLARCQIDATLEALH